MKDNTTCAFEQKAVEVRHALEAGCYHCALALALTFPDICGKIAYPEMQGKSQVGQRYKRWFKEYVRDFFRFYDVSAVLIDEEACYDLRCAFLHEGTFDFKHSFIKRFHLHVDQDDKRFRHREKVTLYSDGIDIDVDVYELCMDICHGAMNFYDSIEDKTLFQDDIIINVGKQNL